MARYTQRRRSGARAPTSLELPVVPPPAQLSRRRGLSGASVRRSGLAAELELEPIFGSRTFSSSKGRSGWPAASPLACRFAACRSLELEEGRGGGYRVSDGCRRVAKACLLFMPHARNKHPRDPLSSAEHHIRLRNLRRLPANPFSAKTRPSRTRRERTCAPARRPSWRFPISAGSPPWSHGAQSTDAAWNAFPAQTTDQQKHLDQV